MTPTLIAGIVLALCGVAVAVVGRRRADTVNRATVFASAVLGIVGAAVLLVALLAEH